MSTEKLNYQCLRCGSISHNSKDIEHSYCGYCQGFTGPTVILWAVVAVPEEKGRARFIATCHFCRWSTDALTPSDRAVEELNIHLDSYGHRRKMGRTT
jgi:hypothetical protein